MARYPLSHVCHVASLCQRVAETAFALCRCQSQAVAPCLPSNRQHPHAPPCGSSTCWSMMTFIDLLDHMLLGMLYGHLLVASATKCVLRRDCKVTAWCVLLHTNSVRCWLMRSSSTHVDCITLVAWASCTCTCSYYQEAIVGVLKPVSHPRRGIVAIHAALSPHLALTGSKSRRGCDPCSVVHSE